MATWEIKDEASEEKKNRAKHGDAGFERRLMVSHEKAAALDNWQEAMFMGPQFESIAMAATDEQFAKLEALPPQKWSRLVCKLAGV